MHALIIFDADHAQETALYDAAQNLLTAHAKVRWVSLSQLTPHSFDDITHLIMAYPPQQFSVGIQQALDHHLRAGMFALPLADVATWWQFRAHSETNVANFRTIR